MACCGDSLGPRLVKLLDCLTLALAECDAMACRVHLAAGTEPVWDACCTCEVGNGQATVNVVQVQPENVATGGGITRCGHDFLATIDISVMRCALVVGDDGSPPDPDALTMETLQVLQDRKTVVQAVRCCFAGEADEPHIAASDWEFGDWIPQGPQGGCVGGKQTILLRFSDPRCA